MSVDEKVTVFVCSQCCSLFLSEEDTRQHQIQDHKNFPPNQELQEQQTPSKDIPLVENDEGESEPNAIDHEKEEEDVIHIQVVVKQGKKKGEYRKREEAEHPCSRRNCPASFPLFSQLQIHTGCHTDGRAFRCQECEILLPTWPACAAHLYKNHEIDCNLLTCSICKTYKTWYPLTLENHMRIHGELRAFVCSECGFAFKQASLLRQHKQLHTRAAAGSHVQCNICFKIYSSNKAVKIHKEEVHNRKRRFVCNVCGHASARKCLLALHQRQHTGHKPYPCSHCNYSAPDHNSLRRHVMRHTGVRQYVCILCSYACVRSSNLKHHMKAKHPAEASKYILTCKECKYTTVSHDSYVRHVSDHLTGTIKGNDEEDKHSNPEATIGEEFIQWLSPAPPTDAT